MGPVLQGGSNSSGPVMFLPGGTPAPGKQQPRRNQIGHIYGDADPSSQNLNPCSS